MDLKPLAGKVLIAPDPVTTETESGLVVVEHWPMEVSGTVIAVGTSPHPRREDAFALADQLSPCDDDDCAHAPCGAARLLRALTGRVPDVQPGDRVLFGLSAGREVRINDTRYFLLAEADLLAVVSTETDVAA